MNLDTSGEHTDSGLVCKSCHDFFVDDSAKILECENCDSHCCAKCLKLTTAQYLTTQREDLWWTCSQAYRSDIRAMMKMRNTLNENTQWKSKIEVFENSISRLEEKIDIQLGLINTEGDLNDLTKPTRDPEEVPDDDAQQEEGNVGPCRLPKKSRTRKSHLVQIMMEALNEQKSEKNEQKMREKTSLFSELRKAETVRLTKGNRMTYPSSMTYVKMALKLMN